MSQDSSTKKQVETKPIKTIYTNRGYALVKKHFSNDTIEKTKKDLMMTPFAPDDYRAKPQPFPIYLESSQKLYLPKFYGFKQFGEPDQVKISKGFDIDVNFAGERRPLQVEMTDKFLNSCKEGKFSGSQSRGGLISVPCAFGKCHAKDTPIMLYDGSIKLVQDIVVGDQLMGDDSTPRLVTSLARGRETMYKVVPRSRNHNSYIVNKSHILSLKAHSNVNINGQIIAKGEIVDISIEDFLKLPMTVTGKLRGYKIAIDFPEKQVEIDPYVLGYWLTSNIVDNNNKNKIYSDLYQPIVDYIGEQLAKIDMKLVCYKKDIDTDSKANSIIKPIDKKAKNNTFLDIIKEYGLENKDHIPDIYKKNSRANRMKLLAGIIDCIGGHGNSSNKYFLYFVNASLVNDIVYLCNSLGFTTKVLYNSFTRGYNNPKDILIYIYGKGIEDIPVLIPYKIFNDANKPKHLVDHLVTKIALEPLPEDDYYGFTIDGNHRYLMGDFTVTHNTFCALYMVSQIKKKTLVIVHKEFLLNQWISEIKRFLPDATIGTIQGQKIDTKGKDIVIGMLQSISMKDYEPELFEEFGFTIIDECHHIAAEVFSRALPKINSYYMLGLSATPHRADGLSKVFHHYLGPFIYKIMTRNDEQKVRVHTIYYSDNHPDYSREELTAFNKVCVPKMVTNIVNCGNRNLLINCLIKRLVADGRKILVLSDRRDHLSCIYSMVYPYATVGYYMGGMKQKELDISAEKQVILGTYPMSSEGLNIPDLDTAIFTTSKSSIEQSIGRIVRKVHQRQPYAFDIVDDFSVFPRQYYKREKIYKKFKYELYETHIETNEKTNSNSFEYQLDHGFKQKRYGKGTEEEDIDSEVDEDNELEEGVQVKPKKKTSKPVAPVECCIEDD